MLPRFFLAAALLLPGGARAQTGGAGALYENAVGGRESALAGAMTSVAGSPSAVHFNPAGLAMLPAPEVQLMRANLGEGASLDSLSYARGLKSRPAGWGAQLLRLASGSVPGRDAFNNETGGYQYGELSLAGGYGTRGLLFPRLSSGLAGKILRRTLPSSADQHFGVDAGLQYGPILNDRVMLGAALRNLFSIRSGDTSDRLPARARAGASWRPVDSALLSFELDNDRAPRLGGEYSFGLIALRAGYAPEGVSFGGGLEFRERFKLDLAVVNTAGAGMTQRVSLSYRFKPAAKKAGRRTGLAEGYLQNGRAEFERRDYIRAGRDFEIALGMDGSVGDGQWKRRAARLTELVAAMDLPNNPQDVAELKAESPMSALAHRSVSALLEGDLARAMLLAHVAAGSGGRDSSGHRLLSALSRVTRLGINREEILSAGPFAQDRARRVVDAVYAGRHDLAVRLAEESLVVVPEDSEAWARLGSAHYAAGRKAEALKAYRKSLERDAGNEKLRRFVAENLEP